MKMGDALRQVLSRWRVREGYAAVVSERVSGEVAESSLSEGPGLVRVGGRECEEGDGCSRLPKPQVQGVWGQGGSLPLGFWVKARRWVCG